MVARTLQRRLQRVQVLLYEMQAGIQAVVGAAAGGGDLDRSRGVGGPVCTGRKGADLRAAGVGAGAAAADAAREG